jgi:hypothetical protein
MASAAETIRGYVADGLRRIGMGSRARSTVRLLLEELDNLHVRRDSYSVDGRYADESYVLQRSGDEWLVYYAERGLRTGVRRFTSEAEACGHLYSLVKHDPTTRE